MVSKIALLGLIAPTVLPFPWMGDVLGSDGSLPNAEAELEKRQGTTMTGCPYNPNHVPAVPATAEFPYLGAVNGLPATHPVGNIEVPTDGDNAHNFVPPGPNDIRGPCPGLNTAANHNVLPTRIEPLCLTLLTISIVHQPRRSYQPGRAARRSAKHLERWLRPCHGVGRHWHRPNGRSNYHEDVYWLRCH